MSDPPVGECNETLTLSPCPDHELLGSGFPKLIRLPPTACLARGTQPTRGPTWAGFDLPPLLCHFAKVILGSKSQYLEKTYTISDSVGQTKCTLRDFPSPLVCCFRCQLLTRVLVHFCVNWLFWGIFFWAVFEPIWGNLRYFQNIFWNCKIVE